MRKVLCICCILSVSALVFSLCGCHARRAKPGEIQSPDGVAQKSEPVRVFGYQASAVIKAKPGELVIHILKDYSWLERASKIGNFKIADLKQGLDMTQLGQSSTLNVRIMGIIFPCQFVTLKYKQEKEMWLIMLTDGSWLLIRGKVSAIPEGSMMDLNIIGLMSKSLNAVTDTLQMEKTFPELADKIVASIQSEFDPEINVQEVTRKGLRGEPFEKFLQCHEARLWINAPPKDIEAWYTTPKNVAFILPEIGVEESYLIQYQQVPYDTMIYTPAVLKMGLLRPKADIYNIKKEREGGKGFVGRIYVVVYDIISFIEMEVQPDAGGSLLTLRMMFELPNNTSGDMMDMLLFSTEIPKLLQKKSIMIKKGVEGRD